MARILAVDDSEQSLLLIRTHLARPEFEVITASSGPIALEHAASHDFDLVILDVHMPQMDGYEVCRRLKAEERTRSIPVIFLSGEHKEPADWLIGFREGAVDYIAKPIYDYEVLRARIRALLAVRAELRRYADRCVELGGRLLAAEEALEAAHTHVDATVRLARSAGGHVIGIALLDGGGRLLEADEGFLHGVPGAELGRPLPVEGDASGLARALRRAVDDGGVAEVRRDDHVLRVEARWLRPGERISACLRDVTEHSRLGDRLARRALPEQRRTVKRNARSGATFSIPGFVGSAECVVRLTDEVARLCQRRCTVLVQGETGTGKELIARALHYAGPDAAKPFLPLHCGSISPELIEAELFGHVKGAFTGASESKQGMFVAADGGTVFLDEIAETSKDLQVKLLRVLQNREVRPVGAVRPMQVDVRIVAATHTHLRDLARRGVFRPDLFYRLEVVTIDVPPLRERVDDIPELIDHFVARFNQLHRRGAVPVRGVSQAALDKLRAYPWPGNVRELENVIERAFVLHTGDTIHEEHLPSKVLTGRPALAEAIKEPVVALPRPSPALDWRAATEASERTLIEQALQRCQGDMMATARLLKMSRSTFYRKCSRLGIRRGAAKRG